MSGWWWAVVAAVVATIGLLLFIGADPRKRARDAAIHVAVGGAALALMLGAVALMRSISL